MTQKKKILLIEDEEDIAALIKLQADISGYRLHVEIDGISGFRAVEREKPDLVILDIMLPGQNGFDVCKKIKSHHELRQIPIIILTAKGEELDVVLGLELGADDYIVKPFSPKVLFSKIKNILRRSRDIEKPPKVATFGEYTLEIDKYTLKKSGALVPITLSEFGILKTLITHRGKVLTRNQLIDAVRSDDASIVDRNIDVHIAALRKKLGPNFEWIDTVRGIGYRFKEEGLVETTDV
jgi:two-component system, OmpR family, alkaline phosphatase synthesis response regulator PhoP